MLGSDSYNELAYFMTQINPSDAPTRGRRIPRPLNDLPSWWSDLAISVFDRFDAWLSSVGLDSHSVSELPPFEELCSPHRTEGGPALTTQSQSFRADAASVTSTIRPNVDRNDSDLRTSEKFVADSELGGNSRHTKVNYHPSVAQPSSPLDSNPPAKDLCEGRDDARPVSVEDDFCLDFLSHLGDKEKEEVRTFLQELDPKQIHLHSSCSWPPTKPGFLDLYSGAKGVATAMASLAETWVITFELNDGPSQDLNSKSLRSSLKKMISYGLFLGWGAAPVCSSFSVAITPPVRNLEFPFGRPDASERMKVKMEDGNQCALWLLDLASLSIIKKVHFWIENPDMSWFFRLPPWKVFVLKHSKTINFWRCDYCRFRKKWRKRTKFLTSSVIKGCSTFCTGDHEHIRLRGRSQKDKKSWTLVAQEYPVGVSMTVASSMLISCGLLPELSNFNSSAFAGTKCRRLGEASHPGPRADRNQNLDAVPLVETRTLELQNKIWAWFVRWLHEQLQTAVVRDVLRQPGLLSSFIKEFGNHLFRNGKSLYVLRHLVVFVQKNMVGAREFLAPCWALINKWEVIEPITHRTPDPQQLS